MPKTNDPSCSSSCNCHSITRRDFVSLLGVGAAAALGGGMPAMAGPFEAADFARLVPADKKLSAAWTTSLFARGTPTVYRGAELEKIGMPIGGLTSGQLYLGGDGKLWHWGIFNHAQGTGDGGYAHPPHPDYPLSQGFGIRLAGPSEGVLHTLDHAGFRDITFNGEYPLGKVQYRDPGVPLAISLEAFSPFIPLNTDDSSLPATVLQFKLKNTGEEKVEGTLLGWLQNGVCLHSGLGASGRRQNRVVKLDGLRWLDCSVVSEKAAEGSARPDVLFDDFHKETYEGWEVSGTAFGQGPILKSQIPSYQGNVGSSGPRVVNSHATAPGANVTDKDAQVGTLTSKSFVIQRNFINFWIGGGNHPGKTCINLLVDGQVMRTATGHDSNAMRRHSLDV